MWERGGRTTRSFENWERAERQLQAFFQFGLRFGDEGLSKLWEEIESRPSDGSEETIDIFDQELGGLGSHEFGWMLGAAVVRDAVTLYEVYLEQAAQEVLQRHGLDWVTEESPRWPDLRAFYMFLGIDLYADEGVRRSRRLRHLLTHKRGALETELDGTQYGSDCPFNYQAVELDGRRVHGALEPLARSVRQIDVVAYAYSWGGKEVSELQAMRKALPDL